MDITVTSGTLEEIQLPHFICVGKVYLTSDPVILTCSLHMCKPFKPDLCALVLEEYVT